MSGALEPGRQVFASLSPGLVIAFYALAVLSIGVFAYGFWRRIARYRTGRPGDWRDRPWARARSVMIDLAAHSTLRKRDGYAGLAHGMMLWGFAVLFAGSLIIAIDQDLLGPVVPEWRFWRGDFYKFFSLALDLMGLGLLAGLLMMGLRRWITHPPRLDHGRAGYGRDDHILLGGLILIVLGGFLNEALRIAIAPPPFEIWSFVGWYLAGALEALGLGGEAAARLHPLAWWFHAVLALGLIAYLPFSKAVHMLLGLAGLFLRDPLAGRRLPTIPEAAERMGYEALGDFSWKELLSLDACTRCGRCHDSCPAQASGWPLSPRDLILQLRETAEAPPGETGLGIGAATLWSCTTCLACVETCPIGVEHVPLIVQMRRNLVEQGDMDRNLQAVLERFARFGNSFGAPESERGNWTEGLDFEVKDARVQAVDYLWFVGDYASFDPHVRRVTQSVARIFHAAGLDFGILHDGERNAGNDIRRIGEEGLFELLSEHNSAALGGARFKRIVTTDPHSHNTLNFEYPDADYPVLHYSEVIRALIAEGRLTIKRRLDGRITYHDPCHLSRYGGLTEGPREILAGLGLTLVEMKRNRANSFCCGGGGGRIWMSGSDGAQRPADQRIEEALEIDRIEQIVVACPKCHTLCREAVTASANEARLAVKDLAEFVADAVL